MTEVALRNEAVTLLNELSEQKLLSAILYMRFIKQQNMEESASAKKHKVLEALAGSVHDDTFIRPEQPSLEQRNCSVHQRDGVYLCKNPKQPRKARMRNWSK